MYSLVLEHCYDGGCVKVVHVILFLFGLWPFVHAVLLRVIIILRLSLDKIGIDWCWAPMLTLLQLYRGVNKLYYPRLDKNVGFWLVDYPLVQNPCYRLVVTWRHVTLLRTCKMALKRFASHTEDEIIKIKTYKCPC